MTVYRILAMDDIRFCDTDTNEGIKTYHLRNCPYCDGIPTLELNIYDDETYFDIGCETCGTFIVGRPNLLDVINHWNGNFEKIDNKNSKKNKENSSKTTNVTEKTEETTENPVENPTENFKETSTDRKCENDCDCLEVITRQGIVGYDPYAGVPFYDKVKEYHCMGTKECEEVWCEGNKYSPKCVYYKEHMKKLKENQKNN